MGKVVSMFDGLVSVLTGRGTSVDRAAHNFHYFQPLDPQQIEAAYRSSWLHRKIVDVPCEDMTRAGRDWDANKADIEAIEAEEKRLKVWAKVREAIRLGRLGGGAIVIGIGNDPTQPLPTTIGKGAVSYLTVVSRWQLTLGDMISDPASPLYGEPAYFELQGTGQQVRIHPSRVIPFKGLPIPAIHSLSWQDRYWGDSVIQAINEAVEHASMAAQGFASLIDEAKVDVYRLAGLAETLGIAGGDKKITDRLTATNAGKSVHRAVILDKEDEWEQRQLTLAGIRDVIITYDGRVAGAADIPATRLFGKAPDGMNASGDGDMDNYRQSIGAKQEMDLRPQMDAIDAVLLPSAGVNLADKTWAFSPLQLLSEKELAEIEAKEAESVSKYVNLGIIAESAMAEVVVNRMTESERWPGLAGAIAKANLAGEDVPEDNPSALTQQEGGDPVSRGGGAEPVPLRRAANDAAPRTLYVSRKLLNGAEFLKWAKSQGFESTLDADDLHVTVMFSRQAVDWMKMGQTWGDDGKLTIPAGGARIVESLGDKGAIVLLFNSSELAWRHEDMKRNGASFDYDQYQPHVSITYNGNGIDLANVEPYRGKLEFGPEIFEEVTEDWEKDKG